MYDIIDPYLTYCKNGGGGATRPLPRDGGVEELYGDPAFGPRPKAWTRGQKWKCSSEETEGIWQERESSKRVRLHKEYSECV